MKTNIVITAILSLSLFSCEDKQVPLEPKDEIFRGVIKIFTSTPDYWDYHYFMLLVEDSTTKNVVHESFLVSRKNVVYVQDVKDGENNWVFLDREYVDSYPKIVKAIFHIKPNDLLDEKKWSYKSRP